MMILVKIIVFIIMISVIVCVHEFGHFYFAKKAGVLCHEFSIGMGPAIYKKKKGETTFSIRAIPIGGYVSMAGEQMSEDMISEGDELGLNLEGGKVKEIVLSKKKAYDVFGKVVRRDLYSRHGEPLEIVLEHEDGSVVTYPVMKDAFYVFEKSSMQIAPYERCFESKSLWQRFISLFAGPLMNFVLAIVIYLICAFITGTPNYSSTVIGEVDSDFPAGQYLQEGDRIKSVNGVSVSKWTDFSKVMNDEVANGEITTTLVIERDGEEKTFVIDNYVVINSIGLSNIGITKDYYGDLSIPSGASVGSVGLRYKTDPDDDAIQISTGDVITAIQVCEGSSGYKEDGWVSVSNWSDIIKALKDVSNSKVYFQFYNYKNENFDTNEDGTYTLYNTHDLKNQVVESYTDEVLTNQRIDKIKVYIGVSPVYHHSFFEMVGAAFKNFWSDFTLIFRTLKLLIWPSEVRQVGINNLSGFVGIFDMLGSYISAGITALLLFMALISVNIGVMNLLPIPALDGGRILFLIIEGITRKPINKKVETWVNNIMFILLMALMIYVTYHDILRIIKK